MNFEDLRNEDISCLWILRGAHRSGHHSGLALASWVWVSMALPREPPSYLDVDLVVSLCDIHHLLFQHLAGALAALQGWAHLLQLCLQQAQAPLLQVVLLPELLMLPGILVHLDLQILGDKKTQAELISLGWPGLRVIDLHRSGLGGSWGGNGEMETTEKKSVRHRTALRKSRLVFTAGPLKRPFSMSFDSYTPTG